MADSTIIYNPTMSDLQEAAEALDELFSSSKIKYAICGGFLAILLGIRHSTEDVDCIVEGGFGRCVKALQASSKFEVPTGLAAGARRVLYRLDESRKLKIELLAAGEFGPVRLNESNTQVVDHVTVLSPTEFVRAKVKAWQSRRSAQDVEDIIGVMESVEGLQIERINPDNGLDELAEENEDVARLWAKIQGE